MQSVLKICCIVMDAIRKCSRYRVLFGTLLIAVMLCLWRDPQVFKNLISVSMPLRMNHSLIGCRSDLMQDAGNVDDYCWRAEYESRVKRVWDTCDKEKKIFMTSLSRPLPNRQNGSKMQCPTNSCPIISDRQQTLFCFIPKVASTHVKRFFLNITNIQINDTLKSNNGAMHLAANDVLRRISPMYYRASGREFDDFYKIVFVRHPFDRLVSAFRSKAERPRNEVAYFYNKYWDPIKKLRARGSTSDQITFKEFVWYLTQTDRRKYDAHWAPFWSRCNPCIMDYDFIGKLETAKQDFLYAFKEARIDFSPEWWIGYEPTHHRVALEYFATIPKNMIRRLYKIYRLDFELFGYSVDEFLLKNLTLKQS